MCSNLTTRYRKINQTVLGGLCELYALNRQLRDDLKTKPMSNQSMQSAFRVNIDKPAWPRLECFPTSGDAAVLYIETVARMRSGRQMVVNCSYIT